MLRLVDSRLVEARLEDTINLTKSRNINTKNSSKYNLRESIYYICIMHNYAIKAFCVKI
jgi:hypothetical protein